MKRLWKMQISPDELRAMHVDQNMSDAAIARVLEVHPSTIREWRNHYGIETRDGGTRQKFAVRSQKRLPRLSEESLREMYIDRRMSDAAISREVGVCNITVANWRRKYGMRRSAPVNLVALPVNELRRMYIDEKQTMESVAKHFKCGESTIRAHIVRAGLGLDSVEVAQRKLQSNREKRTHRMVCRGYRHLRMMDHPSANGDGYVPEHRYVAETAIGRYLAPGEQVHHINLIKLDNREENLAVLPSKTDHARTHKYMERVAAYLCGLSGIRPEPLVFGLQVFWGGRYVTQIDLLSGALRVIDPADDTERTLTSDAKPQSVN